MKKNFRIGFSLVPIALAALLAVVAAGCDAATDWSSDKYAVYWIDLQEDRMLGRKLDDGNFIGRVESTVFAVGEDDRWVVAARRDATGKEFFYYINKDLDTDFKNGADVVEGPFEKPEFEELSHKYDLPKFEKYF